MAKQQTNKNQSKNLFSFSVAPADHNPLPTATSDAPGSSLTFNVAQASTAKITFGANFQMNTNLTSYLYLNVDGTDVKNIRMTNPTAAQAFFEGTRTHIMSLAAGDHTIKLRGLASQPTAAVNIQPYWICEVTG